MNAETIGNIYTSDKQKGLRTNQQALKILGAESALGRNWKREEIVPTNLGRCILPDIPVPFKRYLLLFVTLGRQDARQFGVTGRNRLENWLKVLCY